MSNLITNEKIPLVIDRFWETIPQVWDRIRGHTREIVTDHFDITFEQFHILRQIRKGAASVSELAEIKQISRPAISQAVDNLVNRGWVTRKQGIEDRRYVQLELTPAGNDLITATFKRNRQWMSEKMASLNSEEIDMVIRAMDLLEKTFCENKR